MNEIEFPVEFTIPGVPKSLQAKGKTKARWIEQVRDAARAAVPETFACSAKVGVTIYYFPDERSAVDIDNIIKPILDGLCGPVLLDDAQVDRVVCQRFEPGTILDLSDPSSKLIEAVAGERPVTFVRIHTKLQTVE